jgi:hypothetical protein
MTSQTAKENLKAHNKLLDLQEFEKHGLQGNYRYYQDRYGNEYRWNVNVQKDGNFHGRIWNKRSKSSITFTRKRKNILVKFLYKRCVKANERWAISQKRKEENEAKKLAENPPPTKDELRKSKIMAKIQRLQANIKRNRTKLLRCSTRIKTDEKKVKSCLKLLKN